MKVLIFGATGFLGQEICNLFKLQYIDFATVSRSESADFKIDIANYNDFEILPNDFTTIINCATTLPGNNYLDSEYLDKIYQSNILGSQNICKWIKSQKKITKIINCSTMVVANKPWDIGINECANTYPTGNHVLYCGSKLMQELLFDTFAKEHNIDLVQLRFSTIYGNNMAWSGIICNFIDQAKTHNKIELSNGEKVSADFLNVIDAARIVLASIQKYSTGIINAASGTETFLMDLANIVAENFQDCKVINSNQLPEIEENRSVISTDKLSEMIAIDSFISLENGIKKMLKP